MHLTQWAIRHGVTRAAIEELKKGFGIPSSPDRKHGSSEKAAQTEVIMEATRKGARLWRNNVGCLTDERGVPVRYGLANETAGLNKIVKSSDLVGLKPVVITPQLVGCTLGVFVAREMKAPGWSYSGNEREEAQQIGRAHV